MDIFDEIASLKEVYWKNPKVSSAKEAIDRSGLDIQKIYDAESRLERFRSYLSTFEGTKDGLIESDIAVLSDGMLLKLDSHLPISGSVKARGGIYEVLKTAEEIAHRHGMLSDGDYLAFASVEMKTLLSKYGISVGSTGNLGLSIGIMGAALGFRVTVHMSNDAKKWKKDLLREKGVQVIEYAEDYSAAVENGRRLAADDEMIHFVDDENSADLFFGYAVAGIRLKKQLDKLGIIINESNRLNVHIPCGVGGAPGGIAFGLKAAFGDYVNVFFAEPVKCPSMLIGMASGLHEKVSISDYGIDGITDADGLAVGRPSGFVGKVMEGIVSGIYTVSEEKFAPIIRKVHEETGLFIEPSATLGLLGKEITGEEGIHLAFATGGGMVPLEVQHEYL